MPALSLSKRLVTVPFAGGLNERSDPKQAPPGSFLRLVNCVRTKDNMIQKRRGFTALSNAIWPLSFFGGAPITSAAKLLTYGKELLLTNGATLYSYSPGLGKWAGRDLVPPCTGKRGAVVTWTSSVSDGDIAYANGFQIYCWAQGQFVYTTIVDDATGTTIASATQVHDLGAGHAARVPKLVYPGTGTKVFCVFGDTTDIGKVYAKTLDTALMVSAGQLFTGLTTLVSTKTTQAFDACPLGTGLAVAFVISNAAMYVRFDSSLANVSGSVTSINSLSFESVATVGIMGTIGEAVWVGVFSSRSTTNTARLRFRAHNPSTDVALFATVDVQSWSMILNPGVLAPTFNEAVGWARVDAGRAAIVSRTFSLDTGNEPFITTCLVDNTGALVNVPHTTYSTQLMSRPWAQGGRIFALTLNRDSATQCIVDLNTTDTIPSSARPVCTLAPRISSANSGVSERSGSSLASVVVGASSTEFLTVGTVVQNGLVYSPLGVVLFRLNFASPLAWQNVEMGQSAQFSGGVPSSYDGVNAVEIGYIGRPVIMDMVQGPGGGASLLTLGGTYTWTVVATWVDAKGQTHRSQPASPVTFTIPGTGAGQVNFRIRYLPLTCRTDQGNNFNPKIRLEIFRTGNGGTAFFKLEGNGSTDQDTTHTTWDAGFWIYNDVTTEFTTTIQDGQSDVAISINPQVYTAGGVLESVCPPSSQICFTYKNRFCLIGCDDPKQVWMSQPVLDGEAIRCTDLNVFRVDDGGDLTAGYQMDQTMVLFKEDRLFWVGGDGTSDTGTGADLTSPNRIASDKGCVDQRSVVLLPMGLAYRSSVGFVLLSRSLEVDPSWGRAVQDEIASYPVVTSAVVDKDLGQARWTCLTAEGSATGITVVYDYVSSQWSTIEFANGNPSSTAYLAGAVSSALAAGVYTTVTAAGQAYQESATSYMDQPSAGAASVYVSMIAEGASIATAGLQGAQRVWKAGVLGQRVSSHDLVLELGVNYESAPSVIRRWGSADLDSIEDQPLMSLLASPRPQRCTAIRVRVHDEYPSGYIGPGSGQGPTLSAFSFEVGVSPRTFPRPAAARE